MINIISGMTNSVVLRLNETAPIYLFEFKSVQSGEVFYFTAENISPSSRFFECRILEITDTGLPVALTASTPQIKLTYGGSYNYTLWEANDYSLTPGGNILDKGKMLYKNDVWRDYFG